MPFQNLSGWHAVIILAVILLLFGAAKLPALARSVGQSMKIFKSEIKSGHDDDRAAEPAAEPFRSQSNHDSSERSTHVAGSTETPPKP